VAEKRERASGENAFARFDGYTEFFKTPENRADMLDVLLGVLRCDEHVINVRENEIKAGENRVD